MFLKNINENQNKWKDNIFMDWETQYHKDVNSFKISV